MKGVEMLGDKYARTTMPVSDLNAAVDFYQNKLGLELERKGDMDAFLRTSAGSGIDLYVRGKSKAEHTQLSFGVDDLESEIKDLNSKGIRMELYDMPDMRIKTDEMGVADLDGAKAAWFKDPDDNIIGMFQM
jgi:catechol 2,3-dioxygenase-like lactoylglutathione lyase family enzyme